MNNEHKQLVAQLVDAAKLCLTAHNMGVRKSSSLKAVKDTLVQRLRDQGNDTHIPYQAVYDALAELGITHFTSGRNIYVQCEIDPMHLARPHVVRKMIGNTMVEYDPRAAAAITMLQEPQDGTAFCLRWRGTLSSAIKVARNCMVLNAGPAEAGDIYRYLLRLQSEVEPAQKSATLESN